VPLTKDSPWAGWVIATPTEARSPTLGAIVPDFFALAFQVLLAKVTSLIDGFVAPPAKPGDFARLELVQLTLLLLLHIRLPTAQALQAIPA